MKYKTEIQTRKYINKPFWFFRKLIKILLLKLNLRKISFCKECGIDVRDFDAPDIDWNRVSKYTKGKNTLCWNCYCDYEYLSR